MKVHWILQPGSTLRGRKLTVTSSALNLFAFFLMLIPDVVYAQIPTPSLVYACTGTTSDIDQITATVPTGASPGKIMVTTKGGSASSSTSFTVD